MAITVVTPFVELCEVIGIGIASLGTTEIVGVGADVAINKVFGARLMVAGET